MTTLEKEMKARGISLYLVVQQMGLAPNRFQGSWTKKIRGERQMSMRELEDFCKAVSKLHSVPLSPEAIEKDIVLFMVT